MQWHVGAWSSEDDLAVMRVWLGVTQTRVWPPLIDPLMFPYGDVMIQHLGVCHIRVCLTPCDHLIALCGSEIVLEANGLLVIDVIAQLYMKVW